MKIGWLRVRRRLFATVAVGVGVGWFFPPAYAEPRAAEPRAPEPRVAEPPSQARSDSRIDVAREHYLQGDAYYKLDKFREALAQFEQAYISKSDPSFLYNIAQCHRLMGNRAEAIKYYKRFLNDQAQSPNARVAEKHIRALEASLKATPQPQPQAQPAPPAAAASPVPSPPVAPAATPVPARTPVSPPPPATPPPGSNHLTLNAPSPPASVDSGPAEPPGAPPSPADDEGSSAYYTRPWFWGVVGAVVLGGIVTAVVLSSGGQCDDGRVCR